MFNSDEGDTSSSSSENEGKISSRGYEGPCCQPLKVPPSSPVQQNGDKKVVTFYAQYNIFNALYTLGKNITQIRKGNESD